MNTHHHFGHAGPVDPKVYREAFGPGYQMQLAIDKGVLTPYTLPASVLY